MSIKSVMHQQVLINDTPLDFGQLVSKLNEMTPILTSPNRGFGKKMAIQIQASAKEEKVMIEFFSELVFSSEPSDPEYGYRAEDSINRRGVIIYYIDGNATIEGIYPANGTVMDYQEFVDAYIENPTVRTILDRIMEDLEEQTIPDDLILEKVTNVWDNLEPGKRLFNTKFH